MLCGRGQIFIGTCVVDRHSVTRSSSDVLGDAWKNDLDVNRFDARVRGMWYGSNIIVGEIGPRVA